MTLLNIQAAPKTLSQLLLGFTCIFAGMATQHGCRQQSAYHDDPVPKHDELAMDSAATKETRNVNVYLPPQYAEEKVSFPVVYMPDGGIKEDFPHVANTLDALIKEGSIQPVILVGVENTNRKRDLTGPSELKEDNELVPDCGGSDKFRTFLRDELRPEIEKRYRCNGETTLVGESLAGLFVVETLIVEPTLFDRYISFDPSLWWNDSVLVEKAKEVVSTDEFADKHFWFASSSEEGMEKRASELHETLKSHTNQGLSFDYTHCSDEEHSTIFRAKKESAFKWQLQK